MLTAFARGAQGKVYTSTRLPQPLWIQVQLMLRKAVHKLSVHDLTLKRFRTRMHLRNRFSSSVSLTHACQYRRCRPPPGPVGLRGVEGAE